MSRFWLRYVAGASFVALVAWYAWTLRLGAANHVGDYLTQWSIIFSSTMAFASLARSWPGDR